MKAILKCAPVVISCLLAALGIPRVGAFGQTIPAGYTIPDITLSPDHRYGVTVLRFDTPNPRNSLVEVETGRVLAEIEANTGYTNANHNSIAPSRWAQDNSLLLWEVDGKWCDVALVLVKLQDGAVAWQRDLLKTGQQEILARTKKARPKRYFGAKEQNRENGSDYPDGFTVDVVAEGDKGEVLSLPLTIHVYLTSNPKSIEGRGDTDIESRLNAVIDKDGKFNVTEFHIGAVTPARNW